ncbi:nagb/rpia/CoA transferase-like protein [Sarocladium strictum]
MASSMTAAAKQQLRSIMKQKLSELSPDTVGAQSSSVFASLKSFKPYQNARRISIYLSMPGAEIQTDPIVRHALDAGKQVFVPYLHRSPLETPDTPARVMDMVHLKSIEDYESLKRDRWGIPSVDPATVHERQRILGGPDAFHSEKSSLDLILVPGVAFDVEESGHVRRLGHGKGFYDFFINRYLSRAGDHGLDDTSLQLYGLALAEQLLPPSSEEQIPIGRYDRKLHGLLVGDGKIIDTK